MVLRFFGSSDSCRDRSSRSHRQGPLLLVWGGRGLHDGVVVGECDVLPAAVVQVVGLQRLGDEELGAGGVVEVVVVDVGPAVDVVGGGVGRATSRVVGVVGKMGRRFGGESSSSEEVLDVDHLGG